MSQSEHEIRLRELEREVAKIVILRALKRRHRRNYRSDVASRYVTIISAISTLGGLAWSAISLDPTGIFISTVGFFCLVMTTLVVDPHNLKNQEQLSKQIAVLEKQIEELSSTKKNDD